VSGSSVRSEAVRMPRPHLPRRSISAIIEVPERDDEQAVSMLMAGPGPASSYKSVLHKSVSLEHTAAAGHLPHCSILASTDILESGDEMSRHLSMLMAGPAQTTTDILHTCLTPIKVNTCSTLLKLMALQKHPSLTYHILHCIITTSSNAQAAHATIACRQELTCKTAEPAS
jgi:hypothetical protein